MIAIVFNDLDGKRYAVEKPRELDTLRFMQRIVDGLISLVHTSESADGLDMFVNDEGLSMEHMIFNVDASWYAKQELVGPALFVRCAVNGDTVSVTHSDLERFGVTDHISLITFEGMREIQKLDIMEMFDMEEERS